MSGRIEARLAELGLTLPSAMPPAGNYVGYRVSGPLVHIAGMGPSGGPGGLRYTGKVGDGVDLETARAAARFTALNLIRAARDACGGDLDRVRRVVKLFGMVNAVPDFTDAPKVIDAASEVMVSVFGEAGRHARSAIVLPALPSSITVEIDAVMEISPS